MSRRQRGASLLIPVLLIVTAGAFAVIVAASQSGGDIQGTESQADATEALFLAETGVERATRRFLAGSACSAAGLSENLANLATIGIAAGRTITITAGANSISDFGGVPLPATQCRIQVTGTVTASNVSRTVQAIVDRNDNLIGGPQIAGFDNPPGNNPVASWTGGYYDYTGGLPATAGLNPPNCGRAAYAVKALGGGGRTGSSVGTLPVSFTVNRPVTLRVNFDYRMFRIPNGSAACNSVSGGGACPGVIQPGGGSPAGGSEGQICFTLRDTAGATYNSYHVEVDNSQNLGGGNGVITGEGCAPSSQQVPLHTRHTPCSDRYNWSGGGGIDLAWADFVIGGVGPLSFDQFGFKLYIPPGGTEYEMWIDNIRLQPSTGTIAGIAAWRDCSVSTAPNWCPGV
jgi:hypothetical protein